MLGDDEFAYIFSFLCVVDQTSFRFACKRTNTLPSPNMYQVIHSRLSKHHKDPTRFLSELSKYNAVISGSFMLHCLYDTIPYKDIDIFEYIPVPQTDNVMIGFEYSGSGYDTSYYHCSCSGSGFKVDSFRKYLFDDCMSRKTDEESQVYESISNGPHTEYVRLFDGIFQHIHLPLSPMSYIRRTFDLDICKVVFDGNRLHVRNWMKLIERKDYIRPTSLAIACYSNNNDHRVRIKKYREKGFKIFNHSRHDDMLEYIEEMIEAYPDSGLYGVMVTMKKIVEGEFDLEPFDM